MSKRRKTIIILVLILIIIIFSTGLINTLARYVRNVNLKRQVDIAFWIIDDQYEREENLLLSDISPSENPYEYLISVANFKDNKRTETVFEYNIIIEATTNMPLEYSLKKMDDTNTRGIGKGLQEKDVEEIIRRFGRKKDFKEVER